MPTTTKLRDQYRNGRIGAELTFPKPYLEIDNLIDDDEEEIVNTSAKWERIGDGTYIVRVPGSDQSPDDLPQLSECDAIRRVATQLLLENTESPLTLTPSAD